MSIKIDNLERLYVAQLKDAYSAESQLIEALPKMIEKARSSELRSALEEHLGETRSHRDRLKAIFAGLEFKPGGERCKAMAGLIEEADELVGEHVSDDAAMDAAIICACQKVEHYEIATYGTLAAYAERLGRKGDVGPLLETLDEERHADDTLTNIAEGSANDEARDGGP